MDQEDTAVHNTLFHETAPHVYRRVGEIHNGKLKRARYQPGPHYDAGKSLLRPVLYVVCGMGTEISRCFLSVIRFVAGSRFNPGGIFYTRNTYSIVTTYLKKSLG